MFNEIWSTWVGKGAICCSYLASLDLLYVGDVSGVVAIYDSSGMEHDRLRVDWPVWGVDAAEFDGSVFVAVAESDKERHRGALSLFKDGELVARRVYSSPIWGVAQDGSNVYYTLWDGRLCQAAIQGFDDDQARPAVVNLGGTPYGLLWNLGWIYVAVHGVGIVRAKAPSEPDGEWEYQVQNRTVHAAYNLCVQEPTSSILSGSRNGTICGPWTPEAAFGDQAQVSAVLALGTGAVLAGTLDGHLSLCFSDGSALALRSQDSGIWALVPDVVHEQIFVCSSNGTISAFEVPPTPISAESVEAVSTLCQLSSDEKEAALFELSELEKAYALTRMAGLLDSYNSEELARSKRFADSLSSSGQLSDVARFVSGRCALEMELFDDAIVSLQSISGQSAHFGEAVFCLAGAFRSASQIVSAIRVLQNNLQAMNLVQQVDALSLMSELHESRGEYDVALLCAEEASSINHSSATLRETLVRLQRRTARPVGRSNHSDNLEGSRSEGVLAVEVPLSGATGSGVLSKRRRGEYDFISYIHYEYAPPGDEAKKLLEASLVQPIVDSMLAEGGELRSLDIGCATGRWPLWIARQGFEAHGYDISEAAIQICQGHIARYPELPLSFYSHDICDGVLNEGHFRIVTSMMGTFSHIGPDDRLVFLENICRSLQPNGVFVFTAWNSQSRFCDYLALDGEAAKDRLRRNYIEPDEVESLLQSVGMQLRSSIPFCFLPNSCYESWEDDLVDGGSLVAIDEQLRSVVDARRAQMYMFIAEAPRGGV